MKRYHLPKAGSIDDLTPTDVAPAAVGPRQVRVRLRAASLNYRDLMIVRDQYGRPGSVRPGLVPLSDAAGDVAEVGPDVTRVRVGDRVAGTFHQRWLAGPIRDEFMSSALGGDLDGVLAEERVFDEDGLVPVPAHLSYDEAATLPCAAVTAWDALFNSPNPIRPGDTVLTLGTGGVSAFAIQFARAAGARVIATSSSDEKLAKAKSLGATDGVNYQSTPDWDKAVKELTNGRGVDCVVEVGGAGTLPKSLSAVRRGGTVAVIGLLSGPDGEINPLVLIPKAAVMRGVYVGSRAAFEAMNRAITAHQLRPAIDRTFDFADARAAYRHLASGSHFGKVVIRIP